MPKIIVVTSISGSGKTTLVNWAEDKLGITRLRTCTTRPVRPEETGDEYYFMSKPEFEQHIEHDDFVEYSVVYDNYYGLLKSEVNQCNDKNCIVILDVQGMHKLKALYDNVATIFINPPSIIDTKFRLLSRNTSIDDVEKRLAEVRQELSHIEEFDYNIKAGSLEYMSSVFTALVTSITTN